MKMFQLLRASFPTIERLLRYYNNNNGSSYIAHFTMRFTISGGLFRAAYYGAIGSQAAYNHER
jgi:hypothetical protein